MEAESGIQRPRPLVRREHVETHRRCTASTSVGFEFRHQSLAYSMTVGRRCDHDRQEVGVEVAGERVRTVRDDSCPDDLAMAGSDPNRRVGLGARCPRSQTDQIGPPQVVPLAARRQRVERGQAGEEGLYRAQIADGGCSGLDFHRRHCRTSGPATSCSPLSPPGWHNAMQVPSSTTTAIARCRRGLTCISTLPVDSFPARIGNETHSQLGFVAVDITKLQLFPIKHIHPTPAALLGPGAHEMIGVSASELGMQKVLLMTTGLRGTGIVDDVKGIIENAGVTVEVFDGVESNPKDHNVMDAHVAYVEGGCDGFISLGGGSSHDCTKATRVVVAHDGRSINEFKGELALDNPVLPPHIAVSTTAGTGSETSFAFVVTDTTSGPDNHKFASFAHQIAPSMCIDDPVLFMSMPADLTAYCGFDVLAHAAGAYVSILDAIPSWGPALHAIELTFRYLPTAVGNGYDPVAREQMMYAQYIAGLAFNSAGLDITHSVSHAMSARFDTHHGMGNGIAISRVFEHNVSANYPKFARMAEAMGYDTRGLTDVAAADLAIEGVNRLAADVGIPQNFMTLPDYTKSQVGMNGFPAVAAADTDVEALTTHALGDVCTMTNPKIMTPESMAAVVTDSLVGSRP